MSELFDFFSQHKVGIFVLAGVVFARMMVLQWICWIFRWGQIQGRKKRGDHRPNRHECSRKVYRTFILEYVQPVMRHPACVNRQLSGKDVLDAAEHPM